MATRGSLRDMFRRNIESRSSLSFNSDMFVSTQPPHQGVVPKMRQMSPTSEPSMNRSSRTIIPVQNLPQSTSSDLNNAPFGRSSYQSNAPRVAVEFDQFPDEAGDAQARVVNANTMLSSHALESSVHMEPIHPSQPPPPAQTSGDYAQDEGAFINPFPRTRMSSTTSTATTSIQHQHAAAAGKLFDVRSPNFDMLFGAPLAGTALILGPPGFGKTSLIVSILRKLRNQLDIVFFLTLTQETKEKLQNFMPRQLVIINLAANKDDLAKLQAEGGCTSQEPFVLLSDILRKILLFMQRINQSQISDKTFSDGTTRQGGMRACVVLDDILLDNKFKLAMGKSIEGFIKIAHRANIITLLAAHKDSDIQGEAATLISKRFFVGSWEKFVVDNEGKSAKSLAQSVSTLPSLATFDQLAAVYSTYVKRGTAMVVHMPSAMSTTESGKVEVTLFDFPAIEHVEPFLLCHPDIYRLLHFYSEPLVNVRIAPSGSMSYAPIMAGPSAIKKAIVVSDGVTEDEARKKKASGAVETVIEIVTSRRGRFGTPVTTAPFTMVDHRRPKKPAPP